MNRVNQLFKGKSMSSSRHARSVAVKMLLKFNNHDNTPTSEHYQRGRLFSLCRYALPRLVTVNESLFVVALLGILCWNNSYSSTTIIRLVTACFKGIDVANLLRTNMFPVLFASHGNIVLFTMEYTRGSWIAHGGTFS